MKFAKWNHKGQGKKRCTSIPRIRSRTHEVGYPYSYPVVCTVVSEHLSNPKPYTLSAHPRVPCNKTGHHKPLYPCIINTDFTLIQSTRNYSIEGMPTKYRVAILIFCFYIIRERFKRLNYELNQW